jgi:hypothetical protein
MDNPYYTGWPFDLMKEIFQSCLRMKDLEGAELGNFGLV